jgi:hypothetical protein
MRSSWLVRSEGCASVFIFAPSHAPLQSISKTQVPSPTESPYQDRVLDRWRGARGPASLPGTFVSIANLPRMRAGGSLTKPVRKTRISRHEALRARGIGPGREPRRNQTTRKHNGFPHSARWCLFTLGTLCASLKFLGDRPTNTSDLLSQERDRDGSYPRHRS